MYVYVIFLLSVRQAHNYTPASKKKGYTVLALSVLLFVTNIFRRFFFFFLSNHVSQPLQTWYDDSARGPIRRLTNSCPLVIFFLVPQLGSFWDFAKFLFSLKRTGLENWRSLVRSPARPIFLPRIDDSQCDRIYSPFTAVHCLYNGYVGK